MHLIRSDYLVQIYIFMLTKVYNLKHVINLIYLFELINICLIARDRVASTI